MRIFMFRSESRKELRAFAGDTRGTKLPANHGPWTGIGVIDANKAPPHNFPRAAIEKAIATTGFQLWRMKSDMPAQAPAPVPKPAAKAATKAAPAKRTSASRRPPAAAKKRAAAAPTKRRAQG